MRIDKVCLLGGTGFVGRHLASRLIDQGVRCRILTRRPHRHRELQTLPGIELEGVNIFDENQLRTAFDGCDAVVNLVGILNEDRRQRFRQVHVELVEHIVATCRAVGVSRLLHMSALNADESGGASVYLRTKGEGENRAHTLGRAEIAVTSFRPSVVFGRDDSFVNRFATLVRIPGPMPLACPDARFAPIFVGDLVSVMAQSLTDTTTLGRRLNLCGPKVYRLEEIVRLIAAQVRPNKWIVRMPDAASRIQAGLLQYAPGKPFTPDNYQSLQQDSVCEANDLADFNLQPTSLEAVLDTMFGPGARQSRLGTWRRGN